ncbi:MAG: hypothetical protein H7177_06155 [Rhizobacter sp.]|nr:hypothetical protein [Bacteriovorax sp.]
MKTLVLSLLVLALTSCTAAPTSTPADKTKNESQGSSSTPKSNDAAENDKAQKATEARAENPPVVKPKGKKTSPAQAAKNCICVKMWMPVCGANNKTYGNSCEADCAQVKYTQGECAAKK